MSERDPAIISTRSAFAPIGGSQPEPLEFEDFAQPSSIAASSARSRTPILSCSRPFATARAWSSTATAALPTKRTAINNGGLACGELEQGTTTTVRRRSLSTSVVTTTQGRVF